jgi:23S rRNA pseudouridine1911/1915/1917 synthase
VTADAASPITVSPHQGRTRLDRYLVCQDLQLSRSQIRLLALDRRVLVNGRPAAPSYLVKPGDRISVQRPARRDGPGRPQAQDIPLRIIFEDEHLLVIDKPAGMVVHPAPGNYDGTLVNALLHHAGTLSSAGDGSRPGIVHRLDKETSGLLAVAKTNAAHASLAAQLMSRRMGRTYLAVVWGSLPEISGTIEAAIGRSAFDRKKMAVSPVAGRAAVTRYALLEDFGTASLVELKLLTGRTHQIRVHLQHRGHPVVGDPAYGGRSRLALQRFARGRAALAERMLDVMPRQALHAARLSFIHPASGRPVELEAPLPPDMERLLALLRGSFPCRGSFPLTNK